MHQVCKRSILVLLGILCILLQVGCTNPSAINEISFGEWISKINESAGIHDFLETKPYFMNIPSSSPYYEDIQAAVEWGIIDTSHPIDVTQPITRELVAYTLIHLSNVELVKENGKFRDIQKTQYPKEVSTAINLGLMKVDKNNRFIPTQIMDKDEASELLNIVLDYINGIEYENKMPELTYKSDIEIINEKPLTYDLEQNEATFLKGTNIKENTYFYIDSNLYLVESISDDENTLHAVIKEADISEVIDSLSVAGSEELDFSQAEIIEDYQNDISEETSFVEPTNIKLMSIQKIQKTFDYEDYKVKWRLTSSGIYSEIYKEDSHGGKVYANFTLSKVKPTYKCEMIDGKVDYAYFRIDSTTSEKIGFTKEQSETIYGNFKNLNKDNFIESCKKFFEEKRSVTDIEIPIAKLKIPLASNPTVKVTIELRLHLYASGKAEISFVQDNVIGLEIKDGHMRSICSSSPSSEALIKASIGSTAKLLFGLNMMNLQLANTSMEAGVEASMKSTVHAIEETGNLNSSSLDIPLDLLEDAANVNENILVCGDLKNEWILNATFNSSSSLLGKLGFYKKIKILSGPFLSFPETHIENGHFVKKCTRRSRNYTSNSSSDPIESSQIRIQTYAISLKEGASKTITIKALPKGYELSDIIYTSSNDSVANVDDVGKVVALKEGSARISLETRDGKYSVYCSVLVDKGS